MLEIPKLRLTQPRLEVYSMKFIKNKNKNNCNSNDNNNNNATEFKGTIYIADAARTHDMYNSEKEREYKLLYTELPWKNNLKRRRVYTSSSEEEGEKEEDEGEVEELPVMGPHLGLLMMNYGLVIVHYDTGDATEEKLKLDESVFPWFGKGENYYVKHLDFGDPLKNCNVPFDVQVDCPFRSLKLKCIFFDDSKVVRVQVMWIPHPKPGTDTDTDADADDIYILGKIALSFSSPTIDPYESILLMTPMSKAIKASVKQPIPLLKSVVAIPYKSDFKITADLVAPANIDDVNDDSAATVNGHVDFSDPRVDECPDAFFEGFNLPGFDVKFADKEDYRAKSRSYHSAFFYESRQCIPGEGADIQVTVIVDVSY